MPRSPRALLAAACLAAGALVSCTPDSGEPGASPMAGGGGAPTAGTGGSGGSSSAGSGGSPSAGTGGSSSAGTGGNPSTGGSGGTGGGAGSGGAGGGGAGTGGTPARPDAGGARDAGAASDGAPGAASPFPPGPHRVVLITGDTANPNDRSRLDMIAILTAMKDTHGVVFEEIPANQVRAAALMDRSLLIASPNANYFGVTPEPGLKALPVPIIVSKDGNTDAFGMGAFENTPEYTTDLPVKITIIKPDHPLAAGLTGTVPVLQTRCRLVRGTGLGPDAIKIATTPEEPETSWGIFAYEKGGTMPGNFKAPAKRVGFFWHRPSAPTPEGRKLFIAAVEWALRP